MKSFKTFPVSILAFILSMSATAELRADIIFRGDVGSMQPGTIVNSHNGRESNLALPCVVMRFDGALVSSPQKANVSLEFCAADTEGPANYQMANVSVKLDPRDNEAYKVQCSTAESPDFQYGAPIADCEVERIDGLAWSQKSFEQKSSEIYDALNLTMTLSLKGKRESVTQIPAKKVQVALHLGKLVEGIEQNLPGLEGQVGDEASATIVQALVMQELGLDFCQITRSRLPEEMLFGRLIRDHYWTAYYNATLFSSADDQAEFCAQLNDLSYEARVKSYLNLREELYTQAFQLVTIPAENGRVKLKARADSGRRTIQLKLESDVIDTVYTDETVDLEFKPKVSLRR